MGKLSTKFQVLYSHYCNLKDWQRQSRLMTIMSFTIIPKKKKRYIFFLYKIYYLSGMALVVEDPGELTFSPISQGIWLYFILPFHWPDSPDLFNIHSSFIFSFWQMRRHSHGQTGCKWEEVVGRSKAQGAARK